MTTLPTRKSGIINDRYYLPFDEYLHLLSGGNRTFTLLPSKHDLFSDAHGKLRLGPRQSDTFKSWKRASVLPHGFKNQGKSLNSSPRIAQDGKRDSSRSIVFQSQAVPDCSFVSSMQIMALFEAHFQYTGFATKSLYPRNDEGEALYNVLGRYVVKLFWNGQHRAVEIDDYFPVDVNDKALCVSTKDGELWPCLLEKAFLKMVSFGYDLWSGSNSGIDLYALTGWPLETIPLGVSHGLNSAEGPSEEDWQRLAFGMINGDNLVTATSRPDINEEKTGVARNHAFCVLDCRKDQASLGEFELLFRNPWGEAVGFWLNQSRVRDLFHSLHVNWNVDKKFDAEMVKHQDFTLPKYENSDAIGFSENIQVCLEFDRAVDGQDDKNQLWILISRHVHSTVELENAHEALAVHVFDCQGEFVHDTGRTSKNVKPQFLVKGRYASGPHSSCRVDLQKTIANKLSLVLSTFQASRDVDCTLSIFSRGLKNVRMQRLMDDSLVGVKCRGQFNFDKSASSFDQRLFVMKFLNTRTAQFSSSVAVATTTENNDECHVVSKASGAFELNSEDSHRSLFEKGEFVRSTKLLLSCSSVKSAFKLELWNLDAKHHTVDRIAQRDSAALPNAPHKCRMLVFDLDLSSTAYRYAVIAVPIGPQLVADTITPDFELYVQADRANEFQLISPEDAIEQGRLRNVCKSFKVIE